MIEIIDLSKKYFRAADYSVKNLSLTVGDGEICGLVGRNGAGKSTTIKCLTGILPFKEGQIKIDNIDINKEPIKAKEHIGYVPDDHMVYEKLTGREYVNYMGSLYGVKKQQKIERLEYFADLFKLTYALDNQISSYSHGMKQKICIIGSLIHNPKLWVLDEPMMGLDPQSTHEAKKCIVEHASAGNTVLFSSHNLDIVQKVCDSVAIIEKGVLTTVIDLNQAKLDPNFDLEKYFIDSYESDDDELNLYESDDDDVNAQCDDDDINAQCDDNE
ncbi:MAG: ABC transporter ATP-binding protein [Clostridia bacterium]